MFSLCLLTALVLPQRAVAGPAPTPAALAADTGALRHANGRVPPVAASVRATAARPQIDGRLDDLAWAAAEPMVRFTQQVPNDGEGATERTEVRIVYDDEAIYVGARMFDSQPGRIVARLGRRDDMADSDYFEIDFDSYHDHRTSFQFYVNPVGVKADIVATDDVGNGSGSADPSWDPVWDVATRRDSLGWTAELRIPLSQLRFPGAPAQVWGVNAFRWIHRRGELSQWAWWARTDNGYASFFGHLFGLENLAQPGRLELLPYVAGVEERIDPGSDANPFNDGSREVGRFGLDLKYGLTSNLTLNATVNPDFGQVEADPAVINLTAYETFFEERRPFFVEGAGIFTVSPTGNVQGSDVKFLYSRRIGRAPQGFANARNGFVDQPTNSTVLGAAKLSGRTAGGWSIGLMEAATAREFATVDSAGVRFQDEVEPFTNYAVFRAKRDFGGGASTFGLIATATNRGIGDSRLNFLRTGAYAGGADFTHRFQRNRYGLYAALGYSYIRGDTLAIQAAQSSSARYYQRPDADYVHYDPRRTSLFGWNAGLGFSKERGSHNYRVSVSVISPGFEVNDLGYQANADRINLDLWTGRRWTRPGRVFRFVSLIGSLRSQWNHGGDHLSASGSASGYLQFLNLWSVTVSASRYLRTLSDNLTRGGPLAVAPAGWIVGLNAQSDPRRPLRLSTVWGASSNTMGSWRAESRLQIDWRPAAEVSLSLGPYLSVGLTRQQYVRQIADTTATATYGRRYVFAEIVQRSLNLTGRLSVTLTPTLSLQVYAQPFVATGDHRRFKEFLTPRTTDYLVYGETPGSVMRDSTDSQGRLIGHTVDPDGPGPRPSTWISNPDFNSRSLRGNAVLRWEYRPGSTLYLVWTTSCSADESNPGFNAGQDLRHLCQGRSDNVFAVKLNYWLNL